MPLPSHGRYGYSALPERPVYDWPGGKRLAVYLGLNLETFAFGEGLGARLAPAAGDPDVLNFSWRDYGNRVGAWRLLELFETLGFPASVLVNSALYDEAPELVALHQPRWIDPTFQDIEPEPQVTAAVASQVHHEKIFVTVRLRPARAIPFDVCVDRGREARQAHPHDVVR